MHPSGVSVYIRPCESPRGRLTAEEVAWLQQYEVSDTGDASGSWEEVHGVRAQGVPLFVYRCGLLARRSVGGDVYTYRLDNAADVDRAVQILVQGCRHLAAARV